jgi:hypothetical protein
MFSFFGNQPDRWRKTSGLGRTVPSSWRRGAGFIAIDRKLKGNKAGKLPGWETARLACAGMRAHGRTAARGRGGVREKRKVCAEVRKKEEVSPLAIHAGRGELGFGERQPSGSRT